MATADEARASVRRRPFRISRWRLAGVLVFALPLAVYLAFANQNYGSDAVGYILLIREGTTASLFQPHHLLYNPLGYAVAQVLDGIGVSASTAWTMQVVNSIAGATGVLLFFKVLLKLSGRLGLSTVFTLLLAFSMAYWEYTVEVEVYVVPATFLLASLLLMLDYLSGEKRPGAGLFLTLGLLTSAACLFHEMHTLFVPVIVTFTLFTVKSIRQRALMLALYMAPFVVLVCGGYAAAAHATGNLDSPGSFWGWLTLTFHAGAGWGTLDYTNIPSAAYGLFKTFFARSETRDFLVTGAIDRGGTGIMAVIGVAGLTLAALAALTIAKLKRVYRAHRGLVLVLAVWLAAYGAFCVWFDPYTHEFWIPLLPPIWLLIFLALQQWQPARPRLGTAVPVVLLVLLASVNFAGDILPNSDIANNENYCLAGKIDALDVGEDDLVLIWGPVPLEGYCRLFFDREVRVGSLAHRPDSSESEDITKEEWFSAHERKIEDTLARGGRVFVSENEITPNTKESGAFLGERRFLKTTDYAVFYARYEDRLEPVFSYLWRSKETLMYEIGETP